VAHGPAAIVDAAGKTVPLYPADIASGKAFGDIFHAELLNSSAYRRDLERMKTFLVK